MPHCIDYRGIKLITKKDLYTISRIDGIPDNLQRAKIFTTLDAFTGYHKIIVKKDIQKTASGCRFGIYEFLRMPFGLENSPATF